MKASPQPIDGSTPLAADAVPLQSVFLHVTKACNLNCSYCYFSARRPMRDEMSAAEFSSLWPQLVEANASKVVFTGGEPLLRPDIITLLSGLRNADPGHHVIRCLNSNGHLVTPTLAGELVGLVDEVRVSLDGFAKQNDVFRGAGNFDAAMRALEIYRAVGLDPKVLLTITRQTVPDLEEFLIFLIGRGFISINVHRFRPFGRGRKHEEWCASGVEIKQPIRRALARFGAAETAPPDSGEEDSRHHCGVGRFLNIMPNGDVFPCHVLIDPEFRCGNVRTQSLLDICRRTGLLGELAGLDFRTMARQEPGVMDLTRVDACLGAVYAGNRDLRVWRDHLSLPLVQ